MAARTRSFVSFLSFFFFKSFLFLDSGDWNVHKNVNILKFIVMHCYVAFVPNKHDNDYNFYKPKRGKKRLVKVVYLCLIASLIQKISSS